MPIEAADQILSIEVEYKAMNTVQGDISMECLTPSKPAFSISPNDEQRTYFNDRANQYDLNTPVWLDGYHLVPVCKIEL